MQLNCIQFEANFAKLFKKIKYQKMGRIRERIKSKIPFVKTSGSSADFPGAGLKNASAASRESVLLMFHTGITGLSEAAVNTQRKTDGLNEIAHEKAPSWYRHLFQAFLNPFIGVVLADLVFNIRH